MKAETDHVRSSADSGPSRMCPAGGTSTSNRSTNADSNTCNSH